MAADKRNYIALKFAVTVIILWGLIDRVAKTELNYILKWLISLILVAIGYMILNSDD
jgi:hypothetical protein